MKAVEFFCGAGGTGWGLKQAGFKTLLAGDKWPPAVKTYHKNVGGLPGTVRRLDLIEDFLKLANTLDYAGPVAGMEIIVGSPPCQDFSGIGRRREGQNALLTHRFTMLVAIGRPEWVLIENVREALKSKIWEKARRTLKRHGYGLTEVVLNAMHYGVPQSRNRLIVVGRLGERDGFLESGLREAATKSPMTVRDMLKPDEFPEDRALLDCMYYYMRPFSGNSGVFSIDRPSPTIIRTAPGRPGDTYLNNPHPKDPIPAAQAHVLTRQQISRIQGFPAGWDWSSFGSLTNIDQAVANAVPPTLAEAVGKVILARHHGETIPAVEAGFVDWLCLNGKSDRAAANVKASLNRARRLLGSRTFADPALEIGRLETADGFDSLPTQTKSDLRSAVRLHAEWQAGHP